MKSNGMVIRLVKLFKQKLFYSLILLYIMRCHKNAANLKIVPIFGNFVKKIHEL